MKSQQSQRNMQTWWAGFFLAILVLSCGLSGCDTVSIQSLPEETSPASQACPLPNNQARPSDACPCPVRYGEEGFTRWAVPYCDLPDSYRIRNYAGGSCVHASIETLMHWQGQHQLAQWWRATYAGGEYPGRFHERLNAAGVKFAYTNSRAADGWEFLRKCCELRLGCAVNLPSGHMQTLVGMDAHSLYIIDNNGPGDIEVWSRQRFASNWTGWAVTVVGQAPPPEPFL